MKASKSLTSTLAAAAVVGAISLAYAQTADTTAPPTEPQTMQSQGTPSPDTSMQTPSSTTPDTAVMETERPAQADRN